MTPEIYHKIKVADPTQKVTGTTHFNIKRPQRETEPYSVLTYSIQGNDKARVEIVSKDGQVLVRVTDSAGWVKNIVL